MNFDKKEYIEKCRLIDNINENFSYQFKPSTVSEYVNNTKYSYLMNFVGNPKVLGNEIVRLCSKDLQMTYHTLLNLESLTHYPDVQIAISKVLESASSELHKLEFPNTPVSQWRFEIFKSPQLYWIIQAAKQKYGPAYELEYNYVRNSFRDFNANKEISGLLEYKLAYEGNSKMQTMLYERYHFDPEVEALKAKMINLPKEDVTKDEKIADFWKTQLKNNPNISPSVSTFEILRDCKGKNIDAMYEKAIEEDNPDFYLHIADKYGAETEIGYAHYLKTIDSNSYSRVYACKQILDYCVSNNDNKRFIDFFKNVVLKKLKYNEIFSVYKSYAKNIELIFNDIDFEVSILDRIIANGNSYESKNAKIYKKEHFKRPLFGSWVRI